MSVAYIVSILFLVFGFGFVIFWHELGHFLAAKWVGIRVEQFAVGMGQAICSWRKGIGFRFGNTQKEYERRARELAKKKYPSALAGMEENEITPHQINEAAAELGLGETEYRLNWVPIGGYVKMLGQDDMNPAAVSDDPHSYNRKSIGARMLVVSAGVIMNVILAAIGFMILFRSGFNVSPSVAGMVIPGSPAQKAGGLPGDNILSINGIDVQHNFTKVHLNSALLADGEEVEIRVRRNGAEIPLHVTPRRPGPKQLVGIGVGEPLALEAPQKIPSMTDAERAMAPADEFLMNEGDKIVAVEGKPASVGDYAVLDAALQRSYGAPVSVTVKPADPKLPERTIQVHPIFVEPFGGQQLNFAGMAPRVEVAGITPESAARGKLQVGDAIVAVGKTGLSDTLNNPSGAQLKEFLESAGAARQNVDITVLRGGQRVVVKDLSATVKVDRVNNKRGLGIGLTADVDHVVVAEVLPGSAADVAKIRAGAELLSVGDKPVASWNDVFRILSDAKPGEPVDIAFKTANTDRKVEKLTLSADQLAVLKENRYGQQLQLIPLIVPQKTDSIVTAAKWGVLETRDFILQFYLTLRRFVDGTVSPTNAMGPVGIFAAGTAVAGRGNDWLLWFLCMISANLAVVNFLPIPIVDGGLFLFLVLEKIKGKPLSPRAQNIAQVVGLVLLLGVFLFVTYNDISRMF